MAEQQHGGFHKQAAEIEFKTKQALETVSQTETEADKAVVVTDPPQEHPKEESPPNA